jgi:hypothetical protein
MIRIWWGRGSRRALQRYEFPWESAVAQNTSIIAAVCDQDRWGASVKVSALTGNVVEMESSTQEQDGISLLPYAPEKHIGFSARKYQRNGIAMQHAQLKPSIGLRAIGRIAPDPSIPGQYESVVDGRVVVGRHRPWPVNRGAGVQIKWAKRP